MGLNAAKMDERVGSAGVAAVRAAGIESGSPGLSSEATLPFSGDTVDAISASGAWGGSTGSFRRTGGLPRHVRGSIGG